MEAAHDKNRQGQNRAGRTFRLLRLLTVALSVLIAGVFLNGAGVLSGGYAAPAELSKFVVTIASMLGVASCLNGFLKLLTRQ